MGEKMKAMAQTALEKIEMVEVEKPKAGPGQLLVQIKHTGICGSDIHYYLHGKIGRYVVEYPFLLGHESAGIVAEVGEGVTGFAVGDRVTMEPGYTCGKCEFCKTGRYNLCPDVVFFATPPVQGTLCEYVAHPADMCFKLPDNVSTMEGALVEPLAVGFHAAEQGEARPGKTAAVLGSGCIGLCCLMALREFGVKEVYMTDMIDVRLDKAKELGGIPIAIDKKDPVQEILKATDGRGVDIIIDTSGNAKAAFSTVQMIAPGGIIVMVGLSPNPVFEFDFGTLLDKEATVKTIFRYRNLYPTCIKAIANGLPIGSIVSNMFPFEKANEAFAYNCANKAQVVKAVIEY